MQHFFPLFSLFCFVFGVTGCHWSVLGGTGQRHLRWFFKEKVLNSVLCFYPVVALQSAGPLVGEIRGPSICHLTALADRKPHHRDFLVHVEPFCQFAALWLKDVSWCLKSKQMIKNESNLDASREAAGRCVNTVLLMLYKWRERLILNLVNRKCTKVKAR